VQLPLIEDGRLEASKMLLNLKLGNLGELFILTNYAYHFHELQNKKGTNAFFKVVIIVHYI
jgi:hypothetical protein